MKSFPHLPGLWSLDSENLLGVGRSMTLTSDPVWREGPYSSESVLVEW